MVGNIIDAKCECGYQIELFPGSFQSMAYSKQGYEIDTFPENEIKKLKLKKIPDPYAVSILDLPRIILCPRCKKITLKLTHTGHWDGVPN